MNTTPRWSCRLARASISLFGDPPHRRGPGSGHVAQCADCKRFLAATENVAARLRADAARTYQLAPSGVDQRVLRALRAAEAAPAPRRRTRQPLMLGLAGACAVLAGFLVLFRAPKPSTEPRVAVVATTPVTSDSSALERPAAAAEFVADDATSVTEGVGAVLQQNPLQSEAESVYADAKGAVRFLALNFLPADTAARSDGTRARRRSDG